MHQQRSKSEEQLDHSKLFPPFYSPLECTLHALSLSLQQRDCNFTLDTLSWCTAAAITTAHRHTQTHTCIFSAVSFSIFNSLTSWPMDMCLLEETSVIFASTLTWSIEQQSVFSLCTVSPSLSPAHGVTDVSFFHTFPFSRWHWEGDDCISSRASSPFDCTSYLTCHSSPMNVTLFSQCHWSPSLMSV